MMVIDLCDVGNGGVFCERLQKDVGLRPCKQKACYGCVAWNRHEPIGKSCMILLSMLSMINKGSTMRRYILEQKSANALCAD